MKKKILIVEDHPIFRMGMCELINREKDLTVCGSAEDVPDAMALVESENPDLVILDLSLKSSSGMTLIKDLNKYYKHIPVLVLSMHEESLHAERCLLAGAKGYLMKHESKDSVIMAVRKIFAGRKYISQRIMDTLLDKIGEEPEKKQDSPLHRLTDRELEIFQMIGKGFSSRQIAGHLNLSVKTVSAHKERIKQKLGIGTSGALIRYAVLWLETELS
ncbi:response regulator transcription factor [Desulfococcus multivorans]|uniref:Two component transcriptional regulator, LuxR family n=1 Tax=Desulfococcus multivorans DSM 2059 TaxID=1121405 RepID=S7T6Q8_DESML|nr:response regulator transcription factor [Desulfococcus multivorans]AOY59234.1 two component system response regulator [Desulfococcus multivorans]AQV01456.1 DNA-binding response regulator [Desulfococcus multivorans]EPR32747.1 two component transcriptional regulator, LuxR family [Desulfococcus multivorans DSM 2059]SKA26448.1 two component transcriptional regulator, LuxR family [Desulfococcus multivorans DSM 2059]